MDSEAIRHQVSIEPGAVFVEAEDGAILADVLEASGRPVSLYCRKRGLCGKCLVQIVNGEAGCPEADEAALLARRGSPIGARLACRVTVRGPLQIVVPEASLRPTVVSTPEASACRRRVPLDPPLRKYAVVLEPASLERPSADLDRLLAALPPADWEPCLPALRSLSGLSKPGSESALLTAVVHGRSLLNVEPGDTSGLQYGLAVDLGTTTVAAELVDMASGETVASAAALNAQSRYGADVVSRITAARLDRDAGDGLWAAAWETVNGLLESLLKTAGLAASAVYETVLAGNTAMIHLALGLSTASLTEAPFRPLAVSLPPLPAEETGSAAHPAGRVYAAPAIGGFVGGDISAGLTASALQDGPERVLFVDLGTNGEIVLKNGLDLACASTAAGPAFEGMSIGCGMIAGPGAVCAARIENGRLAVEVIGGGRPTGVCGSGIIDILAAALESGALDPSGAIRSEAGTLEAGPGLVLDRGDVREIQLGAAAVKTGMRLLLARAGIGASDLDEVWVAGAFGSTLDVGHAVGLGLIPDLPPGRIRFLGNASLAGARLLLLSAPERDRCRDLARRVRHVSLAGPAFQDAFLEALPFGRWR